MSSAARIERTCPRCNSAFGEDAAFCPKDGTALERRDEEASDADPYIGTVIHGDIELRSIAGAGATGRVYRAHQRGIDRDVAVKILHRELGNNQTLVQRFHREAKIASKLQHPHVVDVHLAGQLPDGAVYIAMEFLDGMSLAAATAAVGGAMPLERALAIALQICDAVGEAHARGIVHRDLKPENVMLIHRADTSDWVKVLDFGIAKLNLGEQSMQTAAGLIFGTARYISPEGAQGATVGPPGDVYAIATILYQLLAGRTPFDADQALGLLIKHIHDAPPPLRSWPNATSVPEPIARVLMDNLAKNPAHRAPTAKALGNALAAAAREANVSIADVGVVARMSLPDLGRAPKAASLEPTLNDVTALPASVTVDPVAVTATDTRGRTNDPAAATGENTSLGGISGQPAPSPSSVHVAERATKITPGTVFFAFLLGVALTAFVMQNVTRREDAEHAAHVQRARLALANGRYVDPPGDNVHDLVEIGLVKWPGDIELTKTQSDAAHELVTRAMAARSAGDVVGAHALAKTAHDLDPTDRTAKLLLAQYEDEIAAAAPDGGGEISEPRIELHVPSGRARLGVRSELVGRVHRDRQSHAVTHAQFVITGPGLAAEGLVLPAVGADPYSAAFSPPTEGDYVVEFEANVGGATVRAERTMNVTR
ncbi:MAG TPA: serine/threonine-protein kinase [Labilithrix sp.]|nr:serine/threonine-protein kinase [Labilithrix sp.]